MENKNLMGLNLNVDSELIAGAVRETIIASIVEAMGHKEEFIAEFVNSLISEKVRADNGSTPQGYSREVTCSRLEFYVRQALNEVFREALLKMVDEMKPQFREAIRSEIKKRETVDGFVEMFFDTVRDNLQSKYRTNVSLEFIKKDEQY